VAVTAQAGDARKASDRGYPQIAVVGACPDATAVQARLAALLSVDEARAAQVSIQDHGVSFRVAVRDEATTLEDPARDCAARARVAATIAATALQSRRLVLGPPAWTVEKGGTLEWSPAAGGLWAPGLEIRSAFGTGPWSLFGAAGARGSMDLPLDNDRRAEMLRFPLDAGARLTSYRWRARPWVSVGGSLTINGFAGQELVKNERQWRLDVGAIVMVGMTVPLLHRLGVSASLGARWYPRTYHLQIVPDGTVGETPTFWVGPSLSYTLDGKRSSP
jgi:hypothetical protein